MAYLGPLRIGFDLASSLPALPSTQVAAPSLRDVDQPEIAGNSSRSAQKVFDSTLGYPGEGPQQSGSEAPLLQPRNQRDRTRALARAGSRATW